METFDSDYDFQGYIYDPPYRVAHLRGGESKTGEREVHVQAEVSCGTILSFMRESNKNSFSTQISSRLGTISTNTSYSAKEKSKAKTAAMKIHVQFRQLEICS
eukprot:jgi/Bigna1/59683/fgenesh1_kg.6_\